MSELAVMEEKKLKVFQKDTEKLGKSTSDFIANFYPSYGVSLIQCFLQVVLCWKIKL